MCVACAGTSTPRALSRSAHATVGFFFQLIVLFEKAIRIILALLLLCAAAARRASRSPSPTELDRSLTGMLPVLVESIHSRPGTSHSSSSSHKFQEEFNQAAFAHAASLRRGSAGETARLGIVTLKAGRQSRKNLGSPESQVRAQRLVTGIVFIL